MDTNSQRTKGRDGVLSSLNMAITALNLAKDISGIAPAQAVFGSVCVLLTMIRDSMANRSDYIELGLACTDVCKALDRGMNGKKLDDLNQSVCEAINQLTTTVAEIQRKIIKQNGRNPVSRIFQASNDKDRITAWKLDLGRILQVFNTELVMNIHVAVSDIRHDMSKMREEIATQVPSVQTSMLGEPPPPRPRACFGRDDVIERVVGVAEALTPVALVGPGGIGKTSIALAVLHHDHIEQRFGDNHRFIRCDQFPASQVHFLSRLSEVIGAGVENPKDLTPLRSFLSSREMILCLDNAESVLDPRGTNAREIYTVVEELSQFSNICLCITSRISTIPPTCETIDVPPLSTEAARDTFYGIYKKLNGGHSDLVNSILEQLDFHPLSITLLATVAHHNRWKTDRLSKEWKRQRTDVLHTQHDQSLAATIELSLASPMFQELGPDARGLLGVIAFFPQGISEDNLEWLFPTLLNRMKVFDTFCVLSLTYQTHGFFTMLAPLRDHLCPKDPASSPLLHATKDRYFTRLAVYVDPGSPGFEDARWITSEDMNVEHLLDVFTSIDTNSIALWNTCAFFMRHLYWHKQRLVVLGPKIERLPDDHSSKPECLLQLSLLFDSIGNGVECKRLLVHALGLWRGRGDDLQVAEALKIIASADRWLGLYGEGIERAKEALGIYERLDDIPGQAQSLQQLAWLLYDAEQLDAAEEAASRAINLLSDGGDRFPVCECYRLLGETCRLRGETGMAISHYEAALGIASTFNWHTQLFWIHCALAVLFYNEHRIDDVHVQVERAKSHAINNSYHLGRAMELQAGFWYGQGRFEEARSEVSHAARVYEKIGATKNIEDCRAILRIIEEAANNDPS